MDKIDYGSRKHGFKKFELEKEVKPKEKKEEKKLVLVTHDKDGKPYKRPTWVEE